MNWNKIPTALQEKQQWVCHNAAKVPLQPIGNSANINDPANWSSFQDVCEAIQQIKSVQRLTDIGFAFVETDNFLGIDIDGYLYNGQAHPAAKRFTAYLVSPQKWLEKTGTHNGSQKNFTYNNNPQIKEE